MSYFGANLVATLSGLQMYYFTHFWKRLERELKLKDRARERQAAREAKNEVARGARGCQ